MKRQVVAVEDLYTMLPQRAFNYDGGWNHKALIALAASGALSTGLSLLGASLGALVYRGLSGQGGTVATLPAGESFAAPSCVRSHRRAMFQVNKP